jgi:hypothetical protein
MSQTIFHHQQATVPGSMRSSSLPAWYGTLTDVPLLLLLLLLLCPGQDHQEDCAEAAVL